MSRHCCATAIVFSQCQRECVAKSGLVNAKHTAKEIYPPTRTGGPARQIMTILVALISSPEVGPEVQNRVGFVCCSFGGPGNGVTNECPIRKLVPKAEMPRTVVALLLSRACPNQVAPGNEAKPQNGDRVKQKTGLSKKRPYPLGR